MRVEPVLTYHQHSDVLLLELIAQRDPEALEALYERHAQTTYNLIYRIVRDRNSADDILQETFWQVWQKAGEFKGQGAVTAWLYRIARNKSLDHLRRQQARPRPVETDSEQSEDALWARLIAEDPPVEEVAAQRWESEYLRRALAEIPPEQRDCLFLAYFEGMSHRQIAEYTRMPLGTVKTRLRSGVEKLERILKAAGYQARDAG